MAGWRIVFAPDAAEAVRALPPDIKSAVRGALAAISADPHLGKELLRDLHGLRSHRARRYRVVYALEAKKRQIRVVAVAHRSHVYEELAQRRITNR